MEDVVVFSSRPRLSLSMGDAEMASMMEKAVAKGNDESKKGGFMLR